MNLTILLYKFGISLLCNYVANEVIDIIFVYCSDFIFWVVTVKQQDQVY
jgi:hypothetical protein